MDVRNRYLSATLEVVQHWVEQPLPSEEDFDVLYLHSPSHRKVLTARARSLHENLGQIGI